MNLNHVATEHDKLTKNIKYKLQIMSSVSSQGTKILLLICKLI